MGKNTFVLLLVLTIFVIYQLYSILLQQEGSVKPLGYSSKFPANFCSFYLSMTCPYNSQCRGENQSNFGR